MKIRDVLLTLMAFELVMFVAARMLFPEKIEQMTSCLMTVTQ